MRYVVKPALVCLLFLQAALAGAQVGDEVGANPEQGWIVGSVRDAANGVPIQGATVEVIGQETSVKTDQGGSYTIPAVQGIYQLRITAAGFERGRLRDVVVRKGGATPADVRLQRRQESPSGQGIEASVDLAGVEVIEVLGDVTKATEAAQLNLRKKALTVRDNISAEAIKLSPDSDAGEIVQRIPAVTVKDEKYINVRGLNERYTGATLNGNRLPSTDPERRVVPLDLFPADFIESLSLIKTYTPDLPGDFSGGLADIQLKDFPEELTASIGISTAVNSEATFGRFRTYQGSTGWDWLGFGENYRKLPDQIPSRNITQPPSAQAQYYARTLRNIWDVDSKTAPPNYGLNFSIGNAFGNGGAALAGTFSNSYSRKKDELRRRLDPAADGGVEIEDEILFDTSTFETRLGALATGGYSFNEDDDRFTFRAMYNRNSEDQVREGAGNTENYDEVRSTDLKYTIEQLIFGQVAGSHRLPWFDVDWRTAYSQTIQDQPDGRIETRLTKDAWVFASEQCGGCRLWGELDETMTDSAVDVSVPFETPKVSWLDFWGGQEGRVKIGPAYTYRERDHQLRRFRYRKPSTGTWDLTLPTEELLRPENIGPQGFTFAEESEARDSFSATHEIAAGYGMVELPLFPGVRGRYGTFNHVLRLIGGVRTEYSYLTVDSVDLQGNPNKTILNDLDPLPGINLIYSPTEDMNVRLAWSQAVSRPEFRELSPVRYPSPKGLTPIKGNPFLISSSIESYDIRWEWFPEEDAVLSFSLFYKEILDPIEQIATPEAQNVIFTYMNGDSAEILGAELEARGNLGLLWNPLQDFALVTNFTYVDSEVKIPDAGFFTTSKSREMVGQAPYIVNLSLEYRNPDWGTARVLYNTFGERIIAAGSAGLPDIFEQPRHQLDLVLMKELNPFEQPVKAKLAFENLLDDAYSFDQGGVVWREYKKGFNVSFSLSYSY